MEDIEKVLVVWHDARFFSATYKREAILDLKMAQFQSVGYLLAEGTETTVIASERNDEGEFRDITLIPTGSVLKMHRLIIKAGA